MENVNLPCCGFINIAARYLPNNVKIRHFGFSPTGFIIESDEEHTRQIMNEIENGFSLFSTAEQFHYNLQGYSNFPGVHRFFNFWQECEPFTVHPKIIDLSNGKKIIRKTDVFTLVQEALHMKFERINNRIFQFMITFFLRTQELKILDWYSYIPYPENLCETLSKELDAIEQKVYTNIDNGKIPSLPLTKLMHRALLFLVTRDVSERTLDILKFDVQQTMRKVGSREEAWKKHENMMYTLISIFLFLRQWLEKQLSRSIDDEIRVVHVFLDDPETKFVMKAQVCKPTNQTSERFFTTISLEEAQELLADVSVEFVNCDIDRAQHRALPVIGPGGQFCKLAVDVLFELFYDLFFGIKLFQVMKENEWWIVEKFFDECKSLFDCERKSPYFLPVSDSEPISNFFVGMFDRKGAEYRNRPRDELKDEFIHLGLANIFLDIIDYVKDVPENYDTLEAVSYCQTRSLCTRIPWLAEFIHNQNADYRVPGLPKPKECSRTRFKNTCWKDMDLCEANTQSYKERVVQSTISKGDGELDKLILSSNAMEVFAKLWLSQGISVWTAREHELMTDHVSKFLKTVKRKIFVMDNDEFQSFFSNHLNSKIPEEERLSLLGILNKFTSFEEFVKTQHKTVYLRYYCTTVFRRDRHVFTEEVFEVIPFLLAKQGDQVDYEKVDEYKSKCASMTMNLKELKEILDAFDVNKELITLVPDMHYANAALVTMPLYPGNPNIRIKDTSGELFMTVPQAHFEIFQCIVCDVDWDIEVLDTPCESKDNLRALILMQMRVLENQHHVRQQDLNESFMIITAHPNYQERKNKRMSTPLIKLFSKNFDEDVSYSFFLSECNAHRIGYTRLKNCTEKNLETMKMPAWKARILFLHAWIKKFFFDVELYADLRKSVLTGLLHRIPLTKWDTEDLNEVYDLLLSFDKIDGIHENVRKLFVRSAPALRPITFRSTHPWYRDDPDDMSFLERCDSQQYFDEGPDNVNKSLIAEQQQELDARANSIEPTIAELSALKVIIEDQLSSLMGNIAEFYDEENRKFSGINGEPIHIHRILKLRKQLRYVAKQPTLVQRDLKELPRKPAGPKNVEVAKEKDVTVGYVDREDYAEDAARKGVTEEEYLEGLEKEYPIPGVKTVIRDGKAGEETSTSNIVPLDVEPPKPSKNALRKKKRKEKMWERSLNAATNDVEALDISADPDSNVSNDQEQLEQERSESSTSRSSSQDPIVPELPMDASSQTHPKEQRQSKKQVSEEALDQSRNPQKESACCPKCVRTIERCEKAKAELKSECNKNEKLANENRKLKKEKESLEEQLKVFLDKEDEMPRQKLIEKVEDLTKQKEDLEEKELEMQARIAELEKSLKASKNTIEQLTIKNSQLEVYNSESHKSIKALRTEMHKVILASIPYQLPKELSIILADVRDKLDTLRGQDLVGKAASKVERLIRLTKNDEIKERAAHELRKVQLDFREYEEALEKSIELIQKTPFITKPELPMIPDLPDLPQEFYDVWKKENDAKNDAIDLECVVCLRKTKEGEKLFNCPNFPKLMHQECIDGCWKGKDEGICPHCRVFIRKSNLMVI